MFNHLRTAQFDALPGRVRPIVPATVAAALLLGPVIVWAQLPVRAVAIGDVTGVPGVVPSTLFDDGGFGLPAINPVGTRIAFTGLYNAGDEGIFLDDNAALSHLILFGDDLGGSLSGGFDAFLQPTVGAGNHVGFVGLYDGSDEGAFLGSSNATLGSIALLGQTLPNPPGAPLSFDAFYSGVQVNPSGRVAFLSDDSELNTGVFSNASGSLTTIATFDDPIANSSSLIDFPSQPVINASGRVAFQSELDSGGSAILYRDPAGALTAIAESDQPGAPGSTDWDSLSIQPGVNADGHVAFRATYDSGSGRGVFVFDGSSVDPVATLATIAPTTGQNFTNFTTPVMNDAGQVAFIGNYVTGEGVFLGDTSTLDMIALSGDAAPGTLAALGTSYNFSAFNSGSAGLSGLALNAAGRVAFVAVLDDTGGSEGIWATLPDGSLVLIAVVGQTWDLDGDGPGTATRVIESVGLLTGSGGADGRATSLSDDGLLTFRLQFTNASGGSEGVYVVTIPEPRLAGMFLLGLIPLMRRRIGW